MKRVVLALALIACGCQLSPVPPQASPSPLLTRRIESAVVRGQVLAPANVLSSNSGGVVSNGGGNVVTNGGANILSDNGMIYRVTAAPEARAFAGVEVYLADQSGQPVPGLPTVKTDAQGRYAIPGVPPGFSFLVVARFTTTQGAVGNLATIIRSAANGATADVDAATTLVALAATDGHAGLPAGFDAATFSQAVDAARGQIGQGGALPNWADRARVLSAFAALSQEVTELRQAVDSLRGDLQQVNTQLDDLKKQIEDLKKQTPVASPSGTAPTPSPGASATPMPGGSMTPESPTPSGTPESPLPSANPTLAPSTPPASPVPSASPAVDVQSFTVGTAPRGIAIAAGGDVWVANSGSDNVSRLKSTGAPGNTYAVGNQPLGIVTDPSGGVWVTNSLGQSVSRILGDGSVLGPFNTGGMRPEELVLSLGHLFISNYNGGNVTRFSNATKAAVATVAVGTNPAGVALSSLEQPWVVNQSSNTASKLSKDGKTVLGTYVTGRGPIRVIRVDADMWITNFLDGTVTRMTDAGAVVGTYPVGSKPIGLAVDAQKHVWVACNGDNTVVRLGPDGAKIGVYPVGAQPWSVAVAPNGAIWVTNYGGKTVSRLTPQ